MPVDKPDYDEIRRFGQTFTTVVNEVVSGMSANALATYVYLMSKPNDWIIRPTDVRNRFGFGEYTWRKVAKELREKGVMFDRLDRDPDGKVVRRTLYIGSQPIDEMKGCETSIPLTINAKDSSIPLTSNNVAEQQRGSSTPLVSKDLLQSKDNYKGVDISVVPSEYKESIKEYLTHRKAIKKPLSTQQALTRLLNRLSRCEEEGIPASVAIATTIDKGWSDINPEWLRNAAPVEESNEHYF